MQKLNTTFVQCEGMSKITDIFIQFVRPRKVLSSDHTHGRNSIPALIVVRDSCDKRVVSDAPGTKKVYFHVLSRECLLKERFSTHFQIVFLELHGTLLRFIFEVRVQLVSTGKCVGDFITNCS